MSDHFNKAKNSKGNNTLAEPLQQRKTCKKDKTYKVMCSWLTNGVTRLIIYQQTSQTHSSRPKKLSIFNLHEQLSIWL